VASHTTPPSTPLGALLQGAAPEGSDRRDHPPTPESCGFRAEASLQITDEKPAHEIRPAVYEPAEETPPAEGLKPCAAVSADDKADSQTAQPSDENPTTQVLPTSQAGHDSSASGDTHNEEFLKAWLKLDAPRQPSSRRRTDVSSRRNW
jgi:hypothetical protein